MRDYEDDLHEIWQAIRRIDEAIRGNGREGIQVRLDRLERLAKVVTWFGSVLVVALITAVVKIVVFE